MGQAGITSYGISLPRRRLQVDEIIELWMNSSLELVKETQGVAERGVLGLDEDGNTFGVAAAKQAYARLGIQPQAQALYYGTCTNPYDSRPSSTILLEALDLPYAAHCADIQFATKSGTGALIQALAMVQAGLVKDALAVGADTINRHTSPGDLLEPYASCGAGALTVGTEDVVLQVDGIAAYNSDLSDGFRVEGERYIRSGMLLGSAKNEVGVYTHTAGAAKSLMDKLGKKPEDYTYAVLQQNTPGTAYGIAKQLGFTREQVAASIYADKMGDTGSASPLIGLAKVLDTAAPGDTILLVSYGFGAGADALSFTVTDSIKKLRAAKTVQQQLDNKKMVDYKTSIKLEYKYIRPSHPLTAYL